MRKFLFIVLIFGLRFASAQSERVKDSLELALNNSKSNDTNRVNILNDLGWYYRNTGETDKASRFAGMAGELAEKLNYLKGLAKAKNAIGVVNMDLGDYPGALASYNESLKIRLAINDKTGAAWSYNNMGVVLERQGKYDLALKNHFTALKIRESIDDKLGVAASYNNIGQLYMSLKNNREALRYCMLSLQIKKKLNPNSQSVAQSYTNIGIIYHNLENYAGALNSYTTALKISLANDNKRSVANLYNNISTIYNALNDFDKSIQNSLISLAIKKKIGDKNGIASSYVNLGMAYINKKDFTTARKYINEGVAINKETGSKDALQSSYLFLSQIDSSTKNYEKAYNDYKMFIRYRDSLINEENTKRTTEARMQYEFDKKAAADSVKTVEARKVLTLQLEQEKTQRFVLYGGLALMLLFAGFIFNRFKVSQKQKRIIELQKHEVEKSKEQVEEKQGEILDSIKYAKTLQEAILPSMKEIEKYLPESFVLYKPKDIIAGDFYWMHIGVERGDGSSVSESEELGDGSSESGDGSEGSGVGSSESASLEVGDGSGEFLVRSSLRENSSAIGVGNTKTEKNSESKTLSELPTPNSQHIFIAAADCTGHGVPGAMVSVVCSNALNRAVKEFGFTDAGKILNKTRELVIETFEKSDKEVKDGMDISLCSISYQNNECIVQYAGANNSLWYIQNNSFHEIKADKQPIGKHVHQGEFTTHRIVLERGDRLFLFTDGYPDQFGGDKGKKFKYKQLQELLVQTSGLEMAAQKKKLGESFDAWKGNLEQVDDVCVIGIKV